MSERSKLISRLQTDADFRASYIRAKLSVLLPAQIRALRAEMTQKDLGREAGMKQSRISAMETPGATNFNLETLVRLASVFKVGMVVRFVPFSEMLTWENGFSQDSFNVVKIDNDSSFIAPHVAETHWQQVIGGIVEPAVHAKKSPASDFIYMSRSRSVTPAIGGGETVYAGQSALGGLHGR